LIGRPDDMMNASEISMNQKRPKYIPALNRSWLTPLYDPALRYLMREDGFKRRLLDQANLQAGERVLDLGCGTGTLTVMAQRRQPGAEIIGLDGDQQVLEIARRKAAKVGIPMIRWDKGFADQLPYADAHFDKVLSSMMLHHLTLREKSKAFQEVLRVLKPGGSFHIVDFGRPHDRLMRFISGYMSRLERTAENFQGKIPGLLVAAGFSQVEETGFMRSVFGPLSFYGGFRQ